LGSSPAVNTLSSDPLCPEDAPNDATPTEKAPKEPDSITRRAVKDKRHEDSLKPKIEVIMQQLFYLHPCKRQNCENYTKSAMCVEIKSKEGELGHHAIDRLMRQ
jgi:hypothetical protein